MDIKDYLLLTTGNLYWKDKRGSYLGCNLEFAEIAGVDHPENIVGKTDRDLFITSLGEKGVRDIEEIDQNVMRNDKLQIIEEVGVDRFGKIAYYLTKKIPLKNEKGEIVGLVGTSIDITEKKTVEEHQLKGMAIVAAALAHELRTPLATISMGVYSIEKYLQILIDTYQLAQQNHLVSNPIPSKLLKRLSKAVKSINTATKNASVTANMLLMNFSFQKENTYKKKLSISDCVQEALNNYPFLKDRTKILHTDLSDNFIFFGDRLFFSHILFNLIKNALYFIDKNRKGKIFITVEKEKEFNVLLFKDTAQGIAEEDIPHIFDQFFTKYTHHGTGVGLAFCKSVMESWDGSIECRSEYGKYVEFILKFPKIA